MERTALAANLHADKIETCEESLEVLVVRTATVYNTLFHSNVKKSVGARYESTKKAFVLLIAAVNNS